MTAPNRNTLWATAIVDELAKAGLDRIVIAPGSRSTPLTVAAAQDERIRTFSHLDERSAAFFALGQGRRSGRPSAVLSTSGTAAANFHPAVIEAHQGRVPLLVLTADRPPELWDSGANQTIDQQDLYGDAPRAAKTLTEPEPTARKLRSLRTTVARAVADTTGSYPGPVHLNVPFRKPLPPVEVADDVPAGLGERARTAVHGRDGPFVARHSGDTPTEPSIETLLEALEGADRGLIVAGPAGTARSVPAAVATLARRLDMPLLADPLSGLRFGPQVADAPVVGGYDGYLESEAVSAWPDPDLVVRIGASPTSKVLRSYLQDAAGRQFLVDPAAKWREATFTATDVVQAAPGPLAEALLDRLDPVENQVWIDRFERAEAVHWEAVAEAVPETAGAAEDQAKPGAWEGWIPQVMIASSPDPATVFVSNSMPVRDMDRFGEPHTGDLTVLGNRGASGIDGITSTGLGAGSVTDEPVAILVGDLAFFHDTNGLLALDRFDLDATIVLVNNDGGGIFHMLPIEDFDPPFEEQFKTPHGLAFEPLGDVYGFEYARVSDPAGFGDAYSESMSRGGTQVIEVRTDAERSHRTREALAETVAERLAD